MIWEPGATRPLPKDGREQWDARVDRADRLRKTYEPAWDRAIKRVGDAHSQADKYEINALLEHRHVESKKAQLFYDTPEVQLHPIDPKIEGIPIDQVLPLRQKVLNYKLGPNAANLKRTVHEALFDAIVPSGFLLTEIGYDARTVPVKRLNKITGQPETVDVPVWGECFWVRVSPKKLLIPDEFRSTNFDQAPWLGLKLTMPIAQAKRAFRLPADFQASAQKDEALFDHGKPMESTDGLVEYTKLWYRAELFDDTIVNPELYRLLILVKGLDEPAVHIDSPFQSLDEQGRLTDDSMRGNPIHVGTLRDLSDSAYVPSDLVVGEQLANEVNKFRTQAMRNRVNRSPITVIDPQEFEKTEIDKLDAGKKTIFCKPGALARGKDALIASVQVGTEPRDNYTAQDYAERDFERALGRGANQSGDFTKTKRTATEARLVQGNASARDDQEKDRLREFVLAGVRKFDAVLQRTLTLEDVAKILGPMGATTWDQFRQLAGRYHYAVLPDSGVFVDAAQFRAQALDEYNLLREDPRINTEELLKKVGRALGYDDAKFVQPAKEKAPDPPKITLAFNGEDLVVPLSGKVLMDLLVQSGYQLGDGTIQMAAAAHAQLDPATVQAGAQAGAAPPVGASAPQLHGGSAPTAGRINQHQAERTGGVQGVGVVQ